MKKDIIISVDIGGTTFESAVLNKNYLNIIDMSPKDQVRKYSDSESLLEGICKQIRNLLKKNHFLDEQIYGLSIACPGPLDSKSGIILNTPNLKLFRNYALKDKLREHFNCRISIENDANLFALGEWSLTHQEEKVFLGITLGTGLGFGFVLNGELFLGRNGMAAEYGISSCEWGVWENRICLEYVKLSIEKIYGKRISPRIIQNYAKDGDNKAKAIFNEFGSNLGVVLSHVVNMLDPGVIVLGGGLSKSFNIYEKAMIKSICKHSPIFKRNPCLILESTFGTKSHMVGAALNLKKK
tara:strand:- start:3147 stop:4037 length:891 start_codon:yes stop_codon:yes gene_type:complete